MQLSRSQEDYWETYKLIEKNAVARIKDIAAKLNVRRPSVNTAVNELKKQGLVEQEPDGYAMLTKAGTVEAKKVAKRHEILREFLLLLGVPSEVAERDACATIVAAGITGAGISGTVCGSFIQVLTFSKIGSGMDGWSCILRSFLFGSAKKKFTRPMKPFSMSFGSNVLKTLSCVPVPYKQQ